MKHGLSAAPVVGAGGTVLGVLSEKDLFRALYPTYEEFSNEPIVFMTTNALEDYTDDAKHKTVGMIMTGHRSLEARSLSPALQIGGQMVATGVHQVPVIDNGVLVGMVSRGDIYMAILQRHYNLYTISNRTTVPFYAPKKSTWPA